REFGKSAPADRIAVDVLRPEPLVAVAAHRAAAARIESPRGRHVEHARTEDRPEAHPAGRDNIVGHGPIRARVELHSAIGLLPTVERDLRAQPAAEAEAP